MLGADSLDDILRGIGDGTIRGLYVLGGDIGQTLPPEVAEAFGKLEFLVVHDVRLSDLADLADVVFPGAIPFEKNGTMTNAQGRVQRLNPAFPQAGGAREDGAILGYVGQRMGVEMGWTDPAEILEEISGSVEGYGGLTYDLVGDQGVMKGGEEPSEAAGG
jgi:predicted molibdopterin-dependent oxidoreductase YjgC